MDSLCPIDGRYRGQTDEIRDYGFTEKSLILTKADVELKWLLHLIKIFRAEIGLIQSEAEASAATQCVQKIIDNLATDHEAQHSFVAKVSEIESTTKHDTKAVELAIRERLQLEGCPKSLMEMTHFGLTSEDVTGTSFAFMFRRVYENCLLPHARDLVKSLLALATAEKSAVMLSMTHGQPASPTTFGKELCVFLNRLSVVEFTHPFFSADCKGHSSHTFPTPTIKFGGAVGCHSAMVAAFPNIDWLKETELFVESLTSTPSKGDSNSSFKLDLCTTQIANREWMLMRLRSFELQNNILLDLARDLWLYTSRGLLKLQKGSAKEVGSSTMPHKINPIDFENAEGNLIMANGIIDILCTKLSQSRAQRDLSDSTVIRNLGLGFSYTLVAYKSLLKGLQKISFNRTAATAEVHAHPEIISEPIQTILRKYPNLVSDPYEKLKALTRGFSHESSNAKILNNIENFVESLSKDISASDKLHISELLASPETYVGLAEKIAEKVIEHWSLKLSDFDRSHIG